jgi:hypothetical protein
MLSPVRNLHLGEFTTWSPFGVSKRIETRYGLAQACRDAASPA